jgi:4-hydroxybenzoate polyprenyltransferase
MHLTRSPYIRLMRLHQPVGIWLLLWPCWWGMAMATHGLPLLSGLVLFALGAILMRSAGCIINDIADRDIDKLVERTRNRPLASGELSLRQAFMLLAALLVTAAGVVMLLGPVVFMWGVLSLAPVVIYPFMKRISWWPQLFLGFTFNWGALMGWAAVRGAVELPAIMLYIGGIFWTLGYDTIYAHQDKLDDARIGVKSTALRLGLKTKQALGVFYLLAILFWALVQLHFGWQVCNVNLDDPASCRRIFVSNIALGLLVFMGFSVS